MPLYNPGVRTIKEDGQTALRGDVTLSEGANVTLTQVGQDIEIAATVDEADVISIGKSGDPIQGVVTVSEGANMTITRSGQNLEFAASVDEADVISIGKSGDPIQGVVTVSEGSNMTITRSGQNLEFAASPGVTGVESFGEQGGSQLTGDVTISEGSNITLTPSGNNIAIAASTDPAVTSELNSLDGRLDTAESDINAVETAVAEVQGAGGQASSSAIAGPITIDSGSTTLTSNEADLTINNPSSQRSLGILYHLEGRCFANADNAFTNRLEVTIDLQVNVDGGGWNSVVNMNETFEDIASDNPRPFDRQRSWAGYTTVGASGAKNIKARMVATWNGTGTAAYIIDNFDAWITAIGVPL